VEVRGVLIELNASRLGESWLFQLWIGCHGVLVRNLVQ